jgi:uncharacterized protein (DUF427 family)
MGLSWQQGPLAPADSEDIVLLHEPGRYPVACFPFSDIFPDVLRSSDYTTTHRDLGETSWYAVSAGAHSKPRAAWEHIGLPSQASMLAGRVGFAWRARLRLEAGPAVIPDGVDRDLTTDEIAPRPS